MDDIIEYLSNKLEDFDFKKLIFPTIIILLYVGGFVYLLTMIKKDNKPTNNNSSLISNKIEEKEEYIYIDIKGSVKNPGVYKLDIDSRVTDAIKASGGITEDANTRFINLSKKLNDGDVVVVYSNKEIKNAQKENIIYVQTPCVCEEVKNDACYREDNEQNNNGKININTATLEELMTLNGIGESKAKSIIEYRNVNGKFSKIEDIINVNGISETLFNKIKENITI